VAFVWNVQLEITNFIASNLPQIDEIEYITDGCAGQHKNRKNLYNLCNHMQDFGIEATWMFFATSHGKAHFLNLSILRKSYTIYLKVNIHDDLNGAVVSNADC
jgi:hypothetical protein